MTELYWQRYKKERAYDLTLIDDPFWSNVRDKINQRSQPKHHLQLYSMCKSDNPYIRQIKASPNITPSTVAELICRDKACQLQYCLSLQKVSVQNRRRPIDLKGCKSQYQTMSSCIAQQYRRIEQKENELKMKVLGLKIIEKQTKPIQVGDNKKHEKKAVEEYI